MLHQLPIPSFKIKNKIQTAIPFGNGHINDTFRLINVSPDKNDYLLQRINHLVFKNVVGMMNNIGQITKHLNTQIQDKKPNAIPIIPSLIPTLDGQLFYKDKNDNYWRMYVFMKDLVSYDIANNETQIYEGAKTFGTFLAQLDDFPAKDLMPTIPNFHDVVSRLKTFEITVQQDIKGRVKEVLTEIKFIYSLADKMCKIQQLGDTHKIPWRVTHNDTKFNNVLLDKNGKGKMVVDLDTVMPGLVHYDFGDGIRSTVSLASEDAADLNDIQVDLNRFTAFAAGYLDATHSILTPLEIQYLPFAGPLLAYIMGLRFLTDYLDGDIYYKIHFEGQNLQRAKAQLNLCKKLMLHQADFKNILKL